MKVNNLITIDGISGAGKGTLAKSLALELNYSLLDSGNLYRLVGLIAKRLETSNSEEIAKELNSRKIKMHQMHRDEALEAFKIWEKESR